MPSHDIVGTTSDYWLNPQHFYDLWSTPEPFATDEEATEFATRLALEALSEEE